MRGVITSHRRSGATVEIRGAFFENRPCVELRVFGGVPPPRPPRRVRAKGPLAVAAVPSRYDSPLAIL